MKKISIYRIINGVLLVLYVTNLLLQHYLRLFPVHLNNFWFATLLLFLGLSLMSKAIIFKSDSTLWCALLLLFIFAFIVIIDNTVWNYSRMWPLFIEIPAVCSFVVGLIFDQWLNIKVSIVITSIFVPIFLLVIEIINVWWFLLVFFLSISVALYIISLVPERFIFKGSRRNKDGKV